MLEVVNSRSNYLRVVLQDLYDPHNISACLRSAEAFGVQKVDIITLKNSFRTSSVAKGASEWLSITKFSQINQCAKELKNSGYKIFAASPHSNGCSLDELDITNPVAVVFGNEHRGIDSEWESHLDGHFTIPMSGFVESLNISVSAAVSMYQISEKCKKQIDISKYFLSEEQKQEILVEWMKRKYPAWFSDKK